MQRLLTCILVLATASGCSRVEPGLQFDSVEASVEADPSQTSVEVQFPFRNTGSQPVRITRIESTCACLLAQADRALYEPGDLGQITATFTLEGRTGNLEIAIVLQTDSPAQPLIRLLTRVQVPDLVSLEPDMLAWSIGSSPAPKVAIFSVLRPEPISLVSAEPMNDGFEVEWEALEKGRRYAVRVTPVSTVQSQIASIRIETDCEIPAQRRHLLFLQIDHPDEFDTQP